MYTRAQGGCEGGGVGHYQNDLCIYIWEFLRGYYYWNCMIFILSIFCHTYSRCSSGLAGDLAADNVDGKSAQTTPRSVPLAPPSSTGSSRRGSALLPSQQSCEVDDDALANENSLMTELMQVQQLSVRQEMGNKM